MIKMSLSSTFYISARTPTRTEKPRQGSAPLHAKDADADTPAVLRRGMRSHPMRGSALSSVVTSCASAARLYCFEGASENSTLREPCPVFTAAWHCVSAALVVGLNQLRLTPKADAKLVP